MKLINIGYGNVVLAEKIVAVVSPESAPIKRIIAAKSAVICVFMFIMLPL